MDGQQLVKDFQTTMITLATASAAEYEAKRTESDLLQHLESISSGRVLQPAAIDAVEQADITRTSLDAHFKKVQASQLNQMSAAQLEALAEQAQRKYKGRRVQVDVLGREKGAIELIVSDPQRGYRVSPIQRRTISGVIEEVAFDKNVLVLRPGLGLRLLNKSQQNYLVYVIDPNTFAPLVSLQFR